VQKRFKNFQFINCHKRLESAIHEIANKLAVDFNTKLIKLVEKEFTNNFITKLDDLSEEIATLVDVSPIAVSIPEHKHVLFFFFDLTKY
jgi:hypothetical protein